MTDIERYDNLPARGSLYRVFGGDPTQLFEVVSRGEHGWLTMCGPSGDYHAAHVRSMGGSRPWLVPWDAPFTCRLIEPSAWAELYDPELEEADLRELEAGES